ncbi:hypothetical protein [Corynebacterium sp. LaCa142]|uniref:hypothetical protein n=1 Tax=Corynebacterium sp. LaCa142 TaxID=3391425 RepID=UPI003988F589
MTYHLAAASGDLSAIAPRFGVLCCLPATFLVISGLVLHRLPKADHSGIYGDKGLRLFSALILSTCAGLIAGAILVIPSGLDLTVLTGALVFSASAAAITWLSREALACALLCVGAMFLTAGAVISLSAMFFPQDFMSGSMTSLTSYFTTSLVTFLFPGLVSAGIVAFVAVQSQRPHPATNTADAALADAPSSSPTPRYSNSRSSV